MALNPIWATAAACAVGLALAGAACGEEVRPDNPALTAPGAVAQAQRLDALPPKAPPGNAIVVDHSGRKEAGKASIYSPSFDGKKMADGERYHPGEDVVASKTLPLGTVAKVTNLETGKSAEVKVEDRGPFVPGRVVDLTPHVAAKLGLSEKEGLAPVVVKPIIVPQKDGSVKAGAGAAEIVTASRKPATSSPQEAFVSSAPKTATR